MADRITSGWKRFWNRGGIWRAAIVVVVYLGLYELFGLLSGTLFGRFIDFANVLGTPASAFFAVALPVLLGGVVLVLFAWSVGWLPTLYARQPVAGRGWMWIAVVIVLIPIVLRLIATEWSAYSIGVVLVVLFAGLCIGFAEETIARGVVVDLVRKAGHGERVVLVISSLFFAVMHSINILTGQSAIAVGFTVLYTFGFGAMMYLSLRVTGSLIWPILLHAATDPTTILATGGIDAHTDSAGAEGLLSLAGLFNYLYILFGIVAIFLVKNRVDTRATTTGSGGGDDGNRTRVISLED